MNTNSFIRISDSIYGLYSSIKSSIHFFSLLSFSTCWLFYILGNPSSISPINQKEIFDRSMWIRVWLNGHLRTHGLLRIAQKLPFDANQIFVQLLYINLFKSLDQLWSECVLASQVTTCFQPETRKRIENETFAWCSCRSFRVCLEQGGTILDQIWPNGPMNILISKIIYMW